MNEEPHAATAADEELVAAMVRYQAGDVAGFEALYAALAADLGRFFAAAGEREDRGDLVQEAFLAVHRARRTYRPPLPVRAWIFGVARNVLARERRTRWRRARRQMAAERELLSAVPPDPGLGASDIGEALRALPSGRRRVWLLHHLHGYSFREIGARLGIGAEAAKLRSSRATKKLRAALGIEDSGDE